MIRCFRKYFPLNELRVLTNATLIFAMKTEFWDCIRENEVIIHISLYPPMKDKINEIKLKLENERVKYFIFKEVETFARRLTLYPFEDEKDNNERCGSAGCHYLRNGEISKCPDAILVDLMAGEDETLSCLKSNDRVKILEETNAWNLIEKIDNPINLCKKCTHKRMKSIRWERVEGVAQPSDWILPHKYEDEVEKLKKNCDELQQEYERVNNSYSYKIGKLVTWLPRKIRKVTQNTFQRQTKI